MIDPAEFQTVWRHLLTRFGKTYDAGQAAAYLDYLSPEMDTDTFKAAARSLWATAKWFPRPADFLLVRAAGEWRTVIDCMAGCAHPDFAAMQKPDGAWWRLSDRARDACVALGGIPGMKLANERNSLALKTAWEKAYEEATATRALALPAPRPDRALKAAS
jgi:hypothetical protein